MSAYNDNVRVYDEARQRPLKLKSTRASKEDEDARRDMDGFDIDEELARLRRAIKEAETVTPSDNPAVYRFIAEELREWRESPCQDESQLLATTSGSPSKMKCPNRFHRMRVEVATHPSNEEAAALVFCRCFRPDGGATE